MSMARARVLRGLHSALRHSGARATPRASANGRTHLVVGRRYASGGGAAAPPSSDLPWLISALIVTPTACWYLWPKSSTHADSGHGDAHHGHGGDGHGAEVKEGEEHGDASEEAAATDDEAAQEGGEAPEKAGSDDGADAKDSTPGQEKEDEKEGGEAADAKDNTPEDGKANEKEGTAKPSGSEGEGQSTSTASDPNKVTDSNGEARPVESNDGTSGDSMKGQVAADSAGATHTAKIEPDSKGALKKRIDSGLQKDLGEAATTTDSDIGKKQAGMSNTASRHSVQIDQSPEFSKKSEGTPDTAKTVGTVDPNRPAK